MHIADVKAYSVLIAAPERLLVIRRRQWLIETSLHYRRDVTFHEDATRIKPCGQDPDNLR